MRQSFVTFQWKSPCTLPPALCRRFLLCCWLGVFGCQPSDDIASNSTSNGHSAELRSIDSFNGEFRFLSNFWPAPTEYEGILYPTSEHAYQAAKTLDKKIRRQIADLATPSSAKKAGRALVLRPDWNSVKLLVMEACVRDKFTRNPDLAQKLLATGDAHLIEGNTWGDTFWGVCDSKGENHLGIILMKIREELRTAKNNR